MNLRNPSQFARPSARFSFPQNSGFQRAKAPAMVPGKARQFSSYFPSAFDRRTIPPERSGPVSVRPGPVGPARRQALANSQFTLLQSGAPAPTPNVSRAPVIPSTTRRQPLSGCVGLLALSGAKKCSKKS